MKNMMGFNDIKWRNVEKQVLCQQSKIVVAWNNKEFWKVRMLSEELVYSFEARALAVRTITTNQGGKTPGVDGIIWDTPEKKMQAIIELKELKRYKAMPVRRVRTPKLGTNETRPLGIPTIKDRAIQALYVLALAPIAECTGDKTSYGYRKHRSAHDALTYLNLILSSNGAPEWILEADIKKFFDRISHEWILKHIPMNKRILKEWLKSGVLELKQFSETDEGVPQGGVISPVIANMVLDGLTNYIKGKVTHIEKVLKIKPKVNICRYADDFVVTGYSKEILETIVMQAIIEFLEVRQLELKEEKTQIIHITEGFDFLGFNFRRYLDKSRRNKHIFLVKPAKKSLKRIVAKLSDIVRKAKTLDAATLIYQLNPILRGWSNYYRVATSKRAFGKIAAHLWKLLWKWARKKHQRINAREIKKMYFKSVGSRNWVFTGKQEGKKSNKIELFDIANVAIKRHQLVKELNPYLEENQEYFNRLETKFTRKSLAIDPFRKRILKQTNGYCVICKNPIKSSDRIEIHHVVSRKLGGTDKVKNLRILHKHCHAQVTYTKDRQIQALFQIEGVVKTTEEVTPTSFTSIGKTNA